jgi:translocation and assembly module TamB
LALSLALLAGGGAWLLTTSAGLRFVVTRIGAHFAADIEYASLEGRLLGPIHAKRLAIGLADVTITIENLEIDWAPAAGFPRALTIESLRAAGVVVTDSGMPRSTGPAREFTPPDLMVKVNAAEIHALTWIGREQTPVTLHQLVLAGEYNASNIVLARAALRTDETTLELTGQIAPRAPYQLQLDADWQYQRGELPAIAGRSQIEGRLEGLNSRTALTEPVAASIRLDTTGPLQSPEWKVQVEASAVTPSRILDTLPAGTADVYVDAGGSGGQVSGTARLHWPQLFPHAVELDMNATLDGNEISVENALIALEDLPARLRIAGVYTLESRNFSARLDWSKLQWPPQGEAAVESGEGTMTVVGTPANFDADARFRLHNEAAGAADIDTRFTISDRTLQLHSLDAQTLGGTLSATGNGDWRQTATLKLALRGTNLDTAYLAGGLASDLSFKATLELTEDDPAPSFSLEVPELRGQLEGYPVEGDLAASGSAGDIVVSRMRLRQGPNSLTVSGRIGPDNNLNYTLDAPQLDAIHAALTGSVVASGTLSGTADTPHLSGEVEGQNTRIGRFASTMLAASFAIDPREPAGGTLRASVKGVAIGETNLGNLNIDLGPQSGQQRLTARITGGELHLDLAVGATQVGAGWRGEIETLSFGRAGDEPWTSQAATGFAADPVSARLMRSLCLRRQQASACIEGGWHNSEDWLSNWSVRNLALPSLQPYFQLVSSNPIRLGGIVSGQGRLFASAGSPWQADGSFYVEGGSIFQLGVAGTFDQIAFVGASADFRLTPERAAAGFRIDFGNDDFTQAIVETPRSGTPDATATPLSGTLSARFADLARAPLHFREFTRLEGALRIDAKLGGTPAAPTLQGRATLENATAELTELGALLEEISMTADADLKGVDLDATARSGDGSLRLAGHLDWTDDGAAGTLRLTGENANAVSIPQARVNISPDIEIALAKEAMRISGRVEIPFARIQPLTISGARRPSADTVIIGEATAGKTQRRRDLDLDLDVALGDNVRFDGFGLSAILGGALNIANPQGITVGTGELRVREGTYAIGSARLNVDSGVLLFAGGPIDNPGLSVRGIRQMQTVLVGVNVSGTLRTPTVSLFSNPPMRQSDIISYLAFSRPSSSLDAQEGESVDQTSGALAAASAGLAVSDVSNRLGLDEISIRSEGREDDSQLVLGRFITPRIYLSYGFGLFEPINTLRLRLNITERLMLLTESGEESSADVFYTWDR